jgi:hypothetical protein
MQTRLRGPSARQKYDEPPAWQARSRGPPDIWHNIKGAASDIPYLADQAPPQTAASILSTLGLLAGSTVLSALGTVAKVSGDRIRTQAAQAQYGAEAQASDYNAALSSQSAAAERDAAAAESQDYERHNLYALESGIAAQGASGVTPEGSPLMVNSATVREIALGAARIQQGGEKRATELENEAQLYKFRAAYARQAGGYAGQAGGIQAASSILSGASTILSTGASFGARTGSLIGPATLR